MKIVLDTNVYLAALVTPGLCAEVYQYCLQHHELVLSDYILREIQRNLARRFGQSASDISEALELLTAGALKVTPRPLEKPVSRDSSDDPILGTALAGQADYLVSEDKDLLSLKHYRRIRIISSRDFWTEMMQSE